MRCRVCATGPHGSASTLSDDEAPPVCYALSLHAAEMNLRIAVYFGETGRLFPGSASAEISVRLVGNRRSACTEMVEGAADVALNIAFLCDVGP